MELNNAVLSLCNISMKRNNAVELDKVNLSFFPGVIHCVLGKYGSGKSSLVEIIRGKKTPHSGLIIYKDIYYSHLTIKESLKLGISVIQHDDTFIDNLKIKEYLFDRHYSHNASIISARHMANHFNNIRSEYDLPDFGDSPMGKVPISYKFFLSVIKHINQNPGIIFLDEILDKLSADLLSKTIKILVKKSREGMSIVLISNNIDEVYNLAERVYVLKNGKVIYDDEIRKIEKINLIKLAYIEISKSDKDQLADQNFYQLLKYNEAILLELPINLLIVDKEMIVRIANKSARKFFGLSDNKYMNIPLISIFNHNIHVFEAISDAFFHREATVLHNFIIQKKEKTYHINIKTYPIFDGQDFIGFIIAIEDVTDQENSREKLFMSENLASVGLLSAGVAHEINNPLEIISNCASYLSYHINDGYLQQKVKTIKLEVESISKIISNLIGITHQKKYISEIFCLNELIHNLINLLNQNALKKNISILFNDTGQNYFIKADITEIKQILLNIIKNSIEAIDSEGKINIWLHCMQQNNIEIIIEDNGNGIDENLLKNVFLPFYSSKNNGSTNQGLGLYISYNIVKKYNGNITVKNMQNGCRFTIILPLLNSLPYM
jgi:PAS domain S-box-containing protein